ncbi:uncharacterized protein LOC127566385 [Drosophila albomicans]|uniref:Uncharacterized protein LOC127566385 n=1 Tax=Drosophila albomicans TaxID=7291 RepID=A0A9C6TAF6_DROAB|nr:uncharacterized protein LOC127566385 [Drosophila albomicans]
MQTNLATVKENLSCAPHISTELQLHLQQNSHAEREEEEEEEEEKEVTEAHRIKRIKDPEDKDSEEEDDQNNDTDDDFTNGGFEKLANTTVVEVKAVPEYQESEEEANEETYFDALTFENRELSANGEYSMDESEDEEEETDDGDEDDQESPVDSLKLR